MRFMAEYILKPEQNVVEKKKKRKKGYIITFTLLCI